MRWPCATGMLGWGRGAGTASHRVARPFIRSRGAFVALGLLVVASGACSSGPSVEERIRTQTAAWEGTPYKWGGTTREGVDCSAFTQAVFASAFELELPRTTEEQERLGSEVAVDSLQAGDLVFFKTGGFLGLFKKRHVGIYLSNGDFAHASGKGVGISSLNDPFWRRDYRTARHVLDKHGRGWSLAQTATGP